MLYTYDITDIISGEVIARDIPGKKVREILGRSINLSKYVADLTICKGRYRISHNQMIKENADGVFTQEWNQAVKKCKTYPYLNRIKIVPEKKVDFGY